MNSPALAYLSSHRRQLLAIGVGCACVVLAIQMVIRPIREEFRTLARRTAIEQHKLGRNLQVLAPESMETVVAAYESIRPHIRMRVSGAEEGAALLAEIESLARQFGVSLVATKPQDAVGRGFYEEYAVEIEVESKVASFVEFLYTLYSSPQMLRVPRMSIAPQAAGEGTDVKGTLLVTKVALL